MSFLPPVVMEIRANAAQFLSTQEKVAASAKSTAAATVAATQKAADESAAGVSRLGTELRFLRGQRATRP